MNKYFGTDGIRFIFDDDKLNLIKKIALSLDVFNIKKIIIGRDSRISSPIIEQTLTDYLPLKEIISVQEISTPGICYLSLVENCLGIMITSSHNPSEYNGIKIFKNGFKLNQNEITLLEDKIDKIEITSKKQRKIILNNELRQKYFDFLLSNITPSNNRVIFDASNGALSSYIEDVVKKINPENLIINKNPNGTNINKNCGSLHPDSLLKILKEKKYDFGFAFDGDGDRIILSYNNEIFTGDSLIYIFAKYLNNINNSIVLTTFSNLGSQKCLEDLGYKIILSDVGDSNILTSIINNNLSLGGEDSGHIINYNYLPTGDGLLNAILLINIFNKYSLDNALKGYKKFPSETLNLLVKSRTNIITHPKIKDLLQHYKELYKNDLSLVLHRSGTEKYLRVFICHQDVNVINEIKKRLITYIQIIDNHLNVDDYDKNIIDENCTFEDNVTLEGSNNLISSHIKKNVKIIFSNISNSIIDKDTSIGPYSHIRNNSYIGQNVRIGNFVEIKNSMIGNRTKVSHLTYLGDCKIGNDCNIGCGVVSVNYDGKNKFKTIIGDKSFIGCNVNLIAPITIEDHSYIAAGSTITNSISKGSFAIARSQQITKKNYAYKYPFYDEETK